ncbi:MAG: hypothetical protein MI754_04480 [Chromatiales bacterium]|nr:hypothetical protein [Chromatiales bacterium]
MTRDQVGTGILWVIVVGVVVWAGYKTINTLADYAPAIIAALTTIYVALLNHAMSSQRELNLQRQKEKQKNYEKLLSAMAGFIRDPSDRDAWDSIHLYSWVIGSEGVIKKAQEFTKTNDEKSLKSLLDEMRIDVGLPMTDRELMPSVFPKREEGHLKGPNKTNDEQLTHMSLLPVNRQ